LLQATALFGCKLDINDKDKTSWQISSLNEVKFHKLILKSADLLAEYHKNSFLRIYPSPLRLDSSNFDPIPCFLYGI
jgi:hypothetical protein